MIATDELRRLLDERGVEYYRHEDGEPLRELKEATSVATSWRLGSASCCAVECADGTFDLWVDGASPEQAVSATLGPGTCHDTELGSKYFQCSACGKWDFENKHTNYCWHCGRKVVRP